MDCDIASYHVDSFNFLTDVGIQSAAIDIPPVKVRIGEEIAEFSYGAARVGRPSLSPAKEAETSEGAKLYPAECRQRALTYSAPLKVWIDMKVDGSRLGYVECVAGEIPIMLRSKACNLYGLSAEELVKRGEESIEKGGYFVCKGSEKVMRLLVANKRNFPLALERPGLREKGRLFSPYAVMMRSVCGNHRAAVINVHYLESACIVLSIQYEREIFYVPLMYVLKCLTSMSDRAIFEHMTRGRPGDGFWAGCVTNMLSMAQNEGVKTPQDAFIALGSRFRVVLENRFGKWESDTNMTRYLLQTCVCIHLDTDEQKFHCLVLMSQKLIALVKNEIQPESLDNPQFQEASVSGHILLLIIRERLERMLLMTRRRLEIAYNRAPNTFSLTTESLTKAYLKTKGEITNGLEYFLATGNLVTQNGLGLMQKTGFSIIAERINQLRFVSHFRALHRGAFFMEMRTTDVRKLRPEAWGFICPVHTPDGAPCGLLNHVTASCRIVTHYPKTDKLRALLTTVGVVPHGTAKIIADDQPSYPVIVDGDFFGYVPRSKAPLIERYLRQLKVDAKDTRVPYVTEITLIRASNPAMVMTQFPGLYIYTGPGRFIRPVRNLASRSTEFIGIFEQVYLSVVVDPDEAELNVTMHQELHPSALFSFAGSLIPFPDHNQSPRNVYQCQMGKQTMGVPVHAWRTRADGKMYLIQTPQDPLIKLAAYDKYEMYDYPLGTHACVAVISYTGYDMEDAMVINKASYQRGFAHGSVIKVERIDLSDKNGFVKTCDKVFFADPKDRPPSIGEDGLPIPGRMYHKDDIYYSVFDRATGSFDTHKFKYTEAAWCGMVRIIYDDDLKEGKMHALIQWRFARNPIIGDKFASRHGQKGINSFLWPPESLPFAESGMVPDIVFNPHGFPSRMTIGMMIESMAGKAACMHGEHYDASPFVYNEKNTAIKHFGELLSKAGYNYMGNETMYSGVDGTLMEVQIFFGVVYYQRLRHMIADKFQVRSTGSVDPITLQPIKGRKVGGGIRFGEMERDALIAHGTAFCLQDRLFNCSDKDEAYVCATCGSIVSVTKLCKKKAEEEAALHGSQRKKIEAGMKLDYEHILGDGDLLNEGARFAASALDIPSKDPQLRTEMERKQRIQARNFASRHCMICQRVDNVYLTQIPRVFRYLCAELTAMNVRVRFEMAHPKDVFRS